MRYYAIVNRSNKKIQNKIIIFIILLIANQVLTGCKKYLQVSQPTTSISGGSAYTNNASAAAVLTSIYDNMISSGGLLSSGQYSISSLSGLSSDELKNYMSDPIYSGFYSNSLLASNFTVLWPELYQELYVTNAALEGLGSSVNLSSAIKQQLNGEAKFMRAFFHFYAVNLFGDVPLVTTTNYKVNNTIKRFPSAQVYSQIIADLKEAETLLSDNYLTSTGSTTIERVRPNKGAAQSLLARVYLYIGDWAHAESLSDSVIKNTAKYRLSSDLNSVFLNTSSEAIWQLQSIYPGINTWDAYFFVLTSPPGTGYFFCALDSNLLKAFEAGDQRYVNWVGRYTSGTDTFFYSNKYKIGTVNTGIKPTEYTVVIRLAEEYLIRAEARAMQGSNLTGAISDLNVLRSRANLSQLLPSLSQKEVMTAIAKERRIELFTEWGHRWLDLKRTRAIDSVMSKIATLKGGTWNSNWSLYPIPQSEIILNGNLTQNSGYQ